MNKILLVALLYSRETESEKDEVALPVSHSWEVADLGFRSSLIRLQSLFCVSSSKEAHSPVITQDGCR